MTTTEKSTKTAKNGKTTTLHMHHSFGTFLCRPCAGLISRFVGGSEHKTTTSFFFSWTSIQSFRIQLQKSCQHLTNWTRWSKRKKRFAAARFHFLSVVFAAVAVVVAFKLSNIKYPLFSVESYKVATLKKRKQLKNKNYNVAIHQPDLYRSSFRVEFLALWK